VNFTAQAGESLELAGKTLTVREVLVGRPPHVSLQVTDEQGDVYLVWTGVPSWAREVEQVLERVDEAVAGVPRVIDRTDDGEEAVMLLSAPPPTASPFDDETWRAAPRDSAILALQEFTLVLGELH